MPTPTDSLERLKKLSRSAWSHQQLIDLARTNSPNQTFKLAQELGFPVRQAKAVRALAVLHRDLSEAAFLAIFPTAEQPIEDGHVRENRSEPMSDDKTKRVLARITEPGARLRYMAKHGLKEKAAELILHMVKNHLVLCWCDHNDESILFDTLAEIERPEFVSSDDTDQVDRSRNHFQRDLLVFFAQEEDFSKRTKPIAMVDFDGLVDFLDWDKDAIRELLQPVLELMVAKIEPGNSLEHRCYMATERLLRKYFEHDEELAIQVELWLLVSRFRDGRLFELPGRALPVPVKASNVEDRHVLDPIVDRFLELGWDMEQVKAEFLKWIKNKVKTCRPQFMIAVAGAKCFTYQDRRSGELSQILREKYRPAQWKNLIEGSGSFMMRMYCELLDCGMRGEHKDKEDLEFYRQSFVQLLSEGKLARVWQLILGIGTKVLFYAEMERTLIGKAKEYLKTLLPAAFHLACKGGRYGVAAAMLQRFDKEDLFDEMVLIEEVNAEFNDRFVTLTLNYYTHEIPLNENNRWRLRVGVIDEEEMEEENRKPTAVQKASNAAFLKLGVEWQKRFEELQTEWKEQLEGAVELAIELGQPIRFEDDLVYYVAPNWPKN
ncbi:hypothetical protein HQ571_04000 [Candidatus Kuenenbacteria bacterium]|nr:hypothetical protein [Candidatus Kuenenbacteria bacterium]